MKKVIAGIAALLIALSAGTTGVLAAGPGYGGAFFKQAGARNVSCRLLNGAAPRTAENAPAACRFVDEDNDGVCDLCGLNTCHSGNFFDENNDGICDNWQSSRPLDGTGRQKGFRGGRRS